MITKKVKAKRLFDRPIITSKISPQIGENINGPSLIKVPDWIKNPLGKYYLYFAHHRGKYIRMAYSDSLSGPWKIYDGGVLHLKNSLYNDHIASPDVHIDNKNNSILMYFHGKNKNNHEFIQSTRLATSSDGLNFKVLPNEILPWYAKVFIFNGVHYAITMPGLLSISTDGGRTFDFGPQLFDKYMRHCAVYVKKNLIYIFYSNINAKPESILVSTIDTSNINWHDWKEKDPYLLLKPKHKYEGAHLPKHKSTRGQASKKANALRDPAIFVEDNKAYLLYCVAGEAGIAIAKLKNLV